MKQEGINMSQLGKIAGLNPGTVSSILKGNRVMAVDQLDRMTAVLSLPGGHFYEQYIQECMVDAVPNWRRVHPFLYRCAELDKPDCIRQIAQRLTDNLIYSPLLFDVAEDFFTTGKHTAAALLYESVAISERRQHSERLAFCQYRLFTLGIGTDQTQNFRLACQFEPFVDRLDEADQLDALKDLANLYRSLRSWDKVSELAQEMGRRAHIQYSMTKQSKRNKEITGKKPSRPMFVYIAYSNLLLASVCDAQGEYEQALQYTYAYADLSWVKETDPESLHWIQLFLNWAQTNTYINKLMSGDISVLQDYVEYMGAGREGFTELLNIIEAANRYHLDVDHILQQFESRIVSYEQEQSADMYTQQVIPEQSTRLWYELAVYYLRRGLFSLGFKYLLECLEKSSKINNKTAIINCVGLFESFKEFALAETQIQYHNLIEKVWDNNEKEIDPISIGC